MKRPGRLWFKFRLYSLDWEVRILAAKHPALRYKDSRGVGYCMGLCFMNARWIALNDKMSHEQFRIALAHEIQHAIEDGADVDYEKGVAVDVHDRWTDVQARGWVYFMRDNPEVVKYLQGEENSVWARAR